MIFRSLANKISVTYAILGTTWILAGGHVASSIVGADLIDETSFEVAKGLFFIVVTALSLRWLLNREMKRLDNAEAARQSANVRLALLLDQSVEALSHTVGQRDPYTAGHQERVAALAVAIARRMELPESQVSAVHTGALLHDMGKIGIPVEILAKPGRLCPEEFELVKRHAQIGKAIVGKIDFDAVVHACVSQHHERLDGSGYPEGLRGDAILPEARIVAVADIVEAMTSHRPYRPALGPAAAEKEIRALSGTKLDAAAVDACLDLMREGLERVWPGFDNAPQDLRPLSDTALARESTAHP